MPPHPRPQPALDSIDAIDVPATAAARPPGRLQAVPSRHDRDAVWIRVGATGRDSDESSSGSDDDPPENASPVSVSEVESALDGLSVEVEALGASDADEEDLLRVVDHYERLIAERDRAIRDVGATVSPADRRPLAAVRSRIREFTDRLRR